MKTTLLALALAASLRAQTAFEFWPGTTYDPAVPTFQRVLGYAPGERISSHSSLMRYMDTLAAAYPARIKVFTYAKTWEGKRLIYAAVGSEKNIARLSEIQAGMKRLADPRKTNEAEAKRLIASLPAVIWLGYGVHGNEISSPDAALLTAYHLLAARGDKVTDKILEDVLVLIDPTQNPDGRDRFVHNFEQAEGLEADPNQLAAEHNEPWPAGRTNHYHFDMNRDWFALTQPETRGRIKALLDWYPVVFVDLHEMGSDATYYFAPEAVPYNPHLAKDQRDALSWFGRNNSKWFDQFGFNYFTREVYDAFYPGYGASWPSYYGSVAMTYEQASTRGLIVRKSDETVVRFRDTVREHFVASLSTAETAANERAKLIGNFYKYRQTAIEEGSKDSIREYVLPRRGNVTAVDKLADSLTTQGVEVRRSTAPVGDLPAGSYFISLAQPAKRLIRTLLDPHVAMEDSFLKDEEERRKRRLPDEIYDVTAWSLPLLYNIELISRSEPTKGSFETLGMDASHEGTISGKASVAYLVPWGTTASARFMTAGLRADLRILSTDKAFTQNGRKFPRGTLIVRVKENKENVHELVAGLAKSSGAEVVATDTGWVDDGVNFGSRYVSVLKKVSIAMAWDRPTASSNAGHIRFVLERQFGYPVTVVRTQQMALADLSRFQVLILPETQGADYASVLGTGGVRRLKDWVGSGGTLIGIGNAVAFMADPKNALLAIQQENLTRTGETPKKPEIPGTDPRVPGKIFATQAEYEKSIQADSELPDSVQGILARARLDTEHWMTAGSGDIVHALVQGREVYTPIKLDKGVNAATFEAPDKLLASGYMWEENRKQLAFKPFVVVQREGRGNMIAFTQDPVYRAYMDGLNMLFLNAVFRGPAHSR